MNKIKNKKSEPRNLGVTVIAGCISILAIGFAIDNLDPFSIFNLVVPAIVATVSLIVAIYGRKKPLKDLVEVLAGL